MIKKSVIASVFALALSASGAGAGDASVTWTGPYIGVHAGSVHMRNQFFESPNFSDGGNIKDNAAIYGVLAGHNWRHGNWVSGFEFDFGFTNAGGYDGNIDIQSGLNWVGNGRLRIGYILNRTMFFAAGGVSVAQVKQTAFGSTIGLAEQKYFAYGLTIGGGFETYVMPNWLFRAEYLYTSYEKFDQSYAFATQVSNEFDTHIARIALIYQWGGGLKTQPARGGGAANWNGAYAGAHYGSTSMRETHALDLFGTPIIGSTRDRANFFGALAGVNFQRGLWVFGFEADFGLGRISTFEDANILNFPIETQLLWDAHIRARLGYSFGNYLLYVSGGMALAQFQLSMPFSEASTRLFTGYTFGGGIDALLGPNFIFRVEYLYSRFDENTVNTIVDVDMKTETVRAALIYKYESGSAGLPDAPRGSPFNWSGMYVGLHGGYHELTQDFGFLLATDSFRMNGYKAGALIGFNRQMGNLVWGFEADIGLFDGRKKTALSSCLCDEVSIKGIADNHWRARIGYAMGQYLPFVAAGIAFGKFEQTPVLNSAQKRIHVGFTAGAGIDAYFGNNWIGRLEYLLSDYDLRFYNFTFTSGDVTDTTNKTHTVRAAFIYKFNP